MLRDLSVAFYQLAASGLLPARWFEPGLPQTAARAARSGTLQLEIVTHCWRYAHLLAWQLRSLQQFPPSDMQVTVTVFHAEEDLQTVELLRHFGRQKLPNLRWNWQALPREQLFRRSIGRNQAALATHADWVWFTDCDLMFREGCLDALARQLQGRRDALVYPREEHRTELLKQDSEMLNTDPRRPEMRPLDTARFVSHKPKRATGPLQIVHGDVCRAVGYCARIQRFQQAEPHFAKCHEDRVFRWLLRSQGVALDVPGVYRIRHLEKGRYQGSVIHKRLRAGLRQLQGRWRRFAANKA